MSISPLLSNAATHQRLMATVIGKLESAEAGFAHTKFVQDTAASWGTRMVASRSLAEQSEITFLEVLESVLAYYGIGFLGSKVFQRAFHALSPQKFSKEVLQKPLSEIAQKSPQLARKVLPIRLATIIAAVGVAAIAGEYVLLFAKNLLTVKAFKKEAFSDVVNLSDSEGVHEEHSEIAAKAKKRILQCLGIAAGLVAFSGVIARFGGASKGLSNLQKLVQRMDFTFSKGTMSLSRNQLMAYMAIAAIGYMDSCRDNLERKEVGTRLAIILPYILFGAEAVKGGLIKIFGSRFPELLKTGENGAKLVKSLEELGRDAMTRARKRLQTTLSAGQITEKMVQKEASKLLKPMLRGKNALFYIPHAIGILGVGLGTALLNRYWTQVRYEKAQQASAVKEHNDYFETFVVRVIEERQHRGPYNPQEGFRLTVTA